jgi:2-haloacid dehalogenase
MSLTSNIAAPYPGTSPQREPSEAPHSVVQTGAMRGARRLDAVVFDVVETLFGLDVVVDALTGFGLERSTLEVFFTRMLRDGFALGCTGAYRPFADFADASLTVVAPTLDDAQRRSVLSAFGELTAHSDVRPAFERLRSEGVRIATLTNGSATNTARLLERCDLAEFVELVMSVDEIQVWKPQPAPYRHALSRLDLAGDRVAMVAVHAWDTHGAHAAGLVTGWASRQEGVYATVFDPPDVRGADLVEVVDGLLALTS